MKRWLTHLVIASYLGCLAWGILAHTFSYGANSHPAMYMVVWDMFCGWSGFAERTHIIGEGESGTYYELAPGPWGDIQVYGNIDRRHYDTRHQAVAKIAMNTLRHTQHEPMTRIFVVEEIWAKKFNMSDRVWAINYPEEKDPLHYYRVRGILSGEGQLLHAQSSWLSNQFTYAVSNNPRLQSDSRKGRPFYVINQGGEQKEYQGGSLYTPGRTLGYQPSAN